MRRPSRPVRRPVALLGLLAAAVALAAVVGLGHLLRHPAPDDPPQLLPEETGDPRLEIVCPPQPDDELVTSDQLYDCPRHFDGMAVRYRGEAVGHPLRRRDGVWLQLNDDAYAGELGPLPGHRDFRGGNAGVGVFVPLDQLDEVGRFGGPRARGDLVEVHGTFHQVDARGEVAVITATRLEVVEPGHPLDDPPLRDRQQAALVAAMLALAAVLAQRRAAARR